MERTAVSSWDPAKKGRPTTDPASSGKRSDPVQFRWALKEMPYDLMPGRVKGEAGRPRSPYGVCAC